MFTRTGFIRLGSELVVCDEQCDALICGRIGPTDKVECSEDRPKSGKIHSNCEIRKKLQQ